MRTMRRLIAHDAWRHVHASGIPARNAEIDAENERSRLRGCSALGTGRLGTSLDIPGGHERNAAPGDEALDGILEKSGIPAMLEYRDGHGLDGDDADLHGLSLQRGGPWPGPRHRMIWERPRFAATTTATTRSGGERQAV